MGVPNLAGHACTWTETVTATGDYTLTHTAEAGKTHYLAGFSCGGNTSGSNDHFTLTVSDGDTAVIVIDCSGHGASGYVGQTAIVDLSNPLRITQGAKIEMAWTDAASIEVSASMWGFTLDD